MKMRHIIMAAVSACAIFSSNVYARPIDEKSIESGKSAIAVDMGYIYLHGPNRMVGQFLKIPSAIDLEKYEAEWTEEFSKAQAKYPKKLANWERNAASARAIGKKVQDKPVEPTKETFSIDPIELRNAVSFGPQFVFSKSKDSESKAFGYMEEVQPGTYVYYGPVMVDQNGVHMGTCYCMGSVQFEVKPGVVTNLGNFLMAAPEANISTNKGIQMGVWVANTVSMDPTGGEISYELPASLQKLSNEVADVRTAGKIDNFYGLTIDRIPAIKGVLAYERDRIIDLKAQAVAKPTPTETAMPD